MSWRELVEAAEGLRAEMVARDAGLAGLPLAGFGWVTVDWERAAADLARALGEPAGDPASARWTPIDRDPVLGARAWRLDHADEPGAPQLLLLEPDTEGRVAASLARFGEGIAVVYVGEGPAGPGRLVRGGPPYGPHGIVLAGGTVADNVAAGPRA